MATTTGTTLPSSSPIGVPLTTIKTPRPSGHSRNRRCSSPVKPEETKSRTSPVSLMVVMTPQRTTLSALALSAAYCRTVATFNLAQMRRIAVLSARMRWRRASVSRAGSPVPFKVPSLPVPGRARPGSGSLM